MKKLALRTKVARALRGGSRGMTLIEVVVALALLGIIAVTFLGGLTAAARAAMLADVRTTAESLARTQMEYVKSQGYNMTGQEGREGFYEKLKPKVDDGPVPEGYTIWSVNRTGSPVYGAPDDPIIAVAWNSTEDSYADADTGLQKITLVIRHDGEKAIFTLEGYRRSLTPQDGN